MNILRRRGGLTLLVLAPAASSALAAKPSELAETMSHDGLQKVSVKGLDLAYARPGGTLDIRSGLAQVVQEAFVRELQGHSRYPVVNEAGPDVLRVKIHIVDLYVNAPDTPTAARSRTYVMSTGEMTWFAELFDSETGRRWRAWSTGVKPATPASRHRATRC